MRIVLILTGLLFVSLLGYLVLAWMQPSLDQIHADILENYPGLDHISAEELARLDPKEVVLIDVRETSEYMVSRLDQAIQVDPDTENSAFEHRFKSLLHDKTIVFYCSVGRRSSDFMARVQPELERLGVYDSYNLAGGIFEWVNSDLDLEGNKVHPYNAYWGKLISDPSKIAYER